MTCENLSHYIIEPFTYYSNYLDREIKLDAFLPQKVNDLTTVTLLLINDGQDMERLGFAEILDNLAVAGAIEPVLAVGIHCDENRRLEYGTADVLDSKQRGSRAKYHRRFVLEELIPHIRSQYHSNATFKEIAFAGFSLGGLSAMDIIWKHPEIFSKVGAFSGSFWWRLRDLEEGYVEETDRIMHLLVREGAFAPHLKFFFQTGALDETADRNNNGIIDSIDDTLGLIAELEQKGYNQPEHIHYLELADGRHDIPTWAQAMPHFLKWGWGKKETATW